MELACSRWDAIGLERGKIVLLHGMGGTGALWRPVAISLENSYSVLAPDQRGHGRSQIPQLPGGRNAPGYTPLDYGKDIVETIEAQNFSPCWIVGHSMGVRSACAAAYLRPELVRGLVLVDLGFSGVAGGGLGEGLASFLRKLPTEFPSRAEARAFMAAECPDPSIAQYLMAVSAVKNGGPGIIFPFDHAALIETIRSARDTSVRGWVEALGKKGMPILALRGAKSLVWSHEEFEQERNHFKNFSSGIHFEEIADAGHGLPFEKRIEFTARLQLFFDSAV